MLSILTKHGYSQTTAGNVRPKPYRPKSIGDGRKLIFEVFERNRWDEDAQARYFAMKDIEARRLEDLTADDIRAVIGFMEKARMVLFCD